MVSALLRDTVPHRLRTLTTDIVSRAWSLGFAMGWNAWYNWTIILPAVSFYEIEFQYVCSSKCHRDPGDFCGYCTRKSIYVFDMVGA